MKRNMWPFDTEEQRMEKMVNRFFEKYKKEQEIKFPLTEAEQEIVDEYIPSRSKLFHATKNYKLERIATSVYATLGLLNLGLASYQAFVSDHENAYSFALLDIFVAGVFTFLCYDSRKKMIADKKEKSALEAKVDGLAKKLKPETLAKLETLGY